LQCRPGYIMLRLDYSLLGRHMKSPGRNIARQGRISALSRLGRNLSIRLGRHPLPGGPRRPCSPSRPGGPLSFPAWAGASHPAGPGLPAPAWAATPAGPQAACPGWGILPAGPLAGRPGWASSTHSPGGPTSPQRPAGPDQEDPAWPGFIPGPPSSPRSAGPDQEDPAWPGFLPFGPPSGHCSGRARPGFPWPRPDYSSPGRFSPLWAGIYLLRDIFFIRH
jgi:hypothetical protein